MNSGSALNLPPGFRFHPTDEELVTHYLCRRCSGQSIFAPIIAEIDLYKFNPWDLPEMAAMNGEKEWYFFSPRDRKYPNGSRPNRAAGSGYWKATGADKPVSSSGSPKPVAIKKALVFYAGKPPKGVKTNWIMHEYRLADVDRSARKKNNSLRLDDWVLCRIYNKKGVIEKEPAAAAPAEEIDRKPVGSKRPRPNPEANPNLIQYPTAMKKEEVIESDLGEIWPQAPPPESVPFNGSMIYFDTSESVPFNNNAYNTGDSSCSEHVLSPDFSPELSPEEFACEKEVESQSSNYWGDWETTLGFGFNNDSAFNGFGPMSPAGLCRDPVFQQDMFSYIHKPF
ncbi:hypothetical protein LUZ60_007721 [Juncus effusus]|nr:hypothetical protein LUZ60_007721 [Juncus effusus]